MITLVIGGARSGKSTFAESLFRNETEVCYIATACITDEEMEHRVKKHREQRPNVWRTHEETCLISSCAGTEKKYLLDDVTNMISNIMFENTHDLSDLDQEVIEKIELDVKSELSKLIDFIKSSNSHLVMVSNEVGLSIVPENKLARVFRDIQGRVNSFLARESDEVYFMVAGIEVKIK